MVKCKASTGSAVEVIISLCQNMFQRLDSPVGAVVDQYRGFCLILKIVNGKEEIRLLVVTFWLVISWFVKSQVEVIMLLTLPARL